MKKINKLVGFIFIVTSLLMIYCEKQGDNIIGSQDHELGNVAVSMPEILANGISTAVIVATVYNADGIPAHGLKVAFKTTHGKIEKSAFTNYDGQVSVSLLSEASESDLMAEVTATVLDTSFKSIGKNIPTSHSISLHVPGFENKKRLQKSQGNSGTVYIKFIGVTLNAEIEDSVLPADGIAETKVSIKIQETTSQRAIDEAEINLGTRYGEIVGSAKTNEKGISRVYLKAAEQAGEDTLSIVYGNRIDTCLYVSYITPKLQVTPNTSQVPAGGKNKIEITATLLTHNNTPIEGAEIKFLASAGIIKKSAITNDYGQAKVDLIAGIEPDSAVLVVANFLTLSDSTYVSFISTLDDYPNSIILQADPNYIWVKETGNLEQTTISATVLGIAGQPVGNDFGVKFSIINSPDGGEFIEPSSGSNFESSVIPTMDGNAEVYLRAGIRSGTVQVKAELVNYPQVAAQTTNIVIRSGPPYMWINSANPNDVIAHTTVTVECGKANVAFANPVQDIEITAIFGDKYNNPVEEGTAVYFTTTGGIITTDAVTDDKGRAPVTLQNSYPFPYLTTDDPNQLTSCCVPNPNDTTVMLDMNIPDFETNEIVNTLGTTEENDGVAKILAYTWGQDQDGNLVKVWGTLLVVFSRQYHVFNVTANKDTLRLGQSANISIRLYDVHGNPVAANSKLTAKTNAGELSETNLIPSPENYGYGTTYFGTQLINNLDPIEDDATDAVVSIILDSPNGYGKRSVSIYLSLENP